MPKTIMTADDSASIRQMVSFTLKNEGYEVIEAVDGQDALRKLNGSKININMGNIDVKFKYQEGGNYEFITKTGNIDLYLSENSKINLDAEGYVQKNEFEKGNFPTKVRVKTNMGRICINKYS